MIIHDIEGNPHAISPLTTPWDGFRMYYLPDGKKICLGIDWPHFYATGELLLTDGVEGTVIRSSTRHRSRWSARILIDSLGTTAHYRDPHSGYEGSRRGTLMTTTPTLQVKGGRA